MRTACPNQLSKRVQVMTLFFVIPLVIFLQCHIPVGYAQEAGQQENWPPGWTERCLGCICDAASNCNETIGCLGEFCGMFLVSRPYWVDAGSPVLIGDDPNVPEAFTRCVFDSYCAARTVNQYIHRFVQDCNKDGTLSCDDYARLHYLGFNQCTRSLRSAPYYRHFQRCFRNSPNTEAK